MMYFALYFIYAYAQAVFAARLAKDDDVGTVVACMIFAPIVTIIIMGAAFVFFTKLLLKRKN